MVHRSLSFSPSIHVAFLVHFPCRRCPRHFQETGDVRGTLDRMPAYKTRERMVLKSLHRHGADPVTFSPFWFTIRTFYLVFLFFRGERQGKGVGGRGEGRGNPGREFITEIRTNVPIADNETPTKTWHLQNFCCLSSHDSNFNFRGSMPRTPQADECTPTLERTPRSLIRIRKLPFLTRYKPWYWTPLSGWLYQVTDEHPVLDAPVVRAQLL